MAFNQATFAPVGGHSSAAPTVYSYSSQDNLSLVSGNSYFDPKSLVLNQGDVILCYLSDGFFILNVTSDTSTATIGSADGITKDAWGRNKVILDNSLLHGMFTFNVPATMWKESINSVEQLSFTYSTSVNGKLNLVSNGITNDKVKIDTFRNPRYEPNRGHLYSISAFLPDVDRLGQRSFGVFTENSGVMFRLKNDGLLYAVRRTTITGVTSDTEEIINIPAGIDLTKGNTFDIQFQWRGVGNYFFYVNQSIVKTLNLIGELDELSTFDPASPIAFECINQGDDVIIQCGCVDVSSEGGQNNGKTYGSISVNNDSGQVAINGFNQPVMVIRNKKLFGSMVNTRDMISLLATGYADQKSVMRVWATRDETAITLNSQVWDDFGDGHIERIVYGLNLDGTALVGTAMAFDTTKAELIFGARIDLDSSYSTSALFEGRTSIYQTPGDIFIFTMHRENGGSENAGITYEFAESI